MINELINYWRPNTKATILSGAGLSTGSGLPDFRSKQGLWKSRPEELASLESLYGNTDEFYFFYQWRIKKLWQASPNDGHLSIAQLEKRGFLESVITQNVDGFHQRAGSKNVIELHGSLLTVSCVESGKKFDSRHLLPDHDDFEEKYRQGNYKHGKECYAPETNAFLRPDVVLFGEQLPQDSLQRAYESSVQSDLFLVVGSSLMVSPANLFPRIALENGAKLCIINRDPTPYDDLADWVFHEDTTEVLGTLSAALCGDA